MSLLTRRSAFAAFAAALIAPVVVYAQGATSGPAGGVPSTSAPGNSQGTPAGGTGVIGGTRVVPTSPAPAAATPSAPLVGGQQGTAETHRTRRRVRRRVRHHTATPTAPSTTQ